MALLDILTYPDPRLNQVSKPVEKFDADLLRLIEDMKETMHAANGIGLAAAQVGVFLRILVIEIPGETEEDASIKLELCNPEIIAQQGHAKIEEGCLSLPSFYYEVDRAEYIKVRAQNPLGETIELEAEGLLAICVQHEMDHLEGKLLVNYASPLKRKQYKDARKKRDTELDLSETSRL